MRAIRWGVLGYARIARLSVMPAIVRAAGAELTGLASRDPAKREAARTQFGLTRLYASYEELLSDPEIDAIYNPLPNSLHHEWTLRAAEAGKHVLCEKPLALTLRQAREMADACRRRGVTLMEAFMYRYTARTRLVLEVIDSGRLGEIRAIHSAFGFLLDRPDSIKLRPELGGGALYDIGCYPVNFAGLIADRCAGAEPGSRRPDAVAACAALAGGVDQMFSGLLRYPGGLIASVSCGFTAHKHVRSEVIGTEGVLEVPDTFFDNPGVLTVTRGENREEIPVPLSDRYRAEVEDFSAAIRERRAPALGLAESLRNAEVIDRLLAAAGGYPEQPALPIKTMP
ncbi:MAG TPA: Gfo/Idh/MocA family oxidoreductase [Opitutaceae bacterium]|jgi:predicted dehydrogenase|nr:Gfo/Idh/MocA family oxidoreductase [Opitutaceae bacterium]